MGIDIYDVMQGVGSGLVTLGNQRETKRKEELMQKLKLEDEARQEQREVAREERAAQRKAKEVDPRLTKVLPNASGALEEVLFNSNREEIGRGPLSVIDEEKIAFDRSNRERDAKIDDLTIRSKEEELKFSPLEREARLRATNASAAASLASADRQSRGPKDKPEDEGAKRLREARALIAGKLLTPEQAAAKLSAAGYPELAAKLYRAPKDTDGE